MRRWAVLALVLTAGGPVFADDAAPADVAFHRMLLAAKADPAGTDWAKLRAAYAASADYDPAAGSLPEQAGMQAALARADYGTAASLADLALRLHWLDLRTQTIAASADGRIGRTSQAAYHHAIAAGLLRALQATGDGRTWQSAVRVLATSEEEVVFSDALVRLRNASRIEKDGHWYDVLTLINIADRKRRQAFVNVDLVVARETLIAGGQVRPVTDDELP